MKRCVALLFVILLFTGCSRQLPPKDILAKVNNYEITKEEFYDEFSMSPYAKEGTLDAKKEFLRNLVDRKLILQDAQKKGLDRNKDFLKMIQRFWEQSLLKLAIEKRFNDIITPSNASIHKVQNTESALINDWLLDLKKESRIKINYKILEEK